MFTVLSVSRASRNTSSQSRHRGASKPARALRTGPRDSPSDQSLRVDDQNGRASHFAAAEPVERMIRVREGASFAPSGVLRLELNDEEKDEVLAVARRMLLQIRADG